MKGGEGSRTAGPPGGGGAHTPWTEADRKNRLSWLLALANDGNRSHAGLALDPCAPAMGPLFFLTLSPASLFFPSSSIIFFKSLLPP